MKKLMLVVALGLGITGAYAQKIKSADVPAAVKATFEKQFPSVKDAKWEKENGNFEAGWESNKVKMACVIDGTGKLMETETSIAVSELPKGVTDYVAKNMAGKKIKEAAKLTDPTGKVTYEAEVNKEDYIFDEKGAFVKKAAPEADEKKKEGKK